MSTKFLITIAGCFFVVFALGIAAVVGVNAWSESAKDVAPVAAVETPAPIASLDVPTFLPPVATVAPLPPRAVDTPAPVAAPITAVTVQNSDIDALASAVRLGDRTASVDKQIWAKETPVAQRLLNGLCDCDQRNWLKHFVQTGNEAVNGSEHFYQSFQLLAQLRRNNQDLASQAPR